MTDQELYAEIHNQLFKNGSCVPNEWYFIKVIDGEKMAAFEVIYPAKGNIRVRKPISKRGVNYDGEIEYNYDVYRFTNKHELKYEGVFHSTRPQSYVNLKEVI